MSTNLRYIGKLFTGQGDPSSDDLSGLIGNFPVGTIYVNSVTKKIFVRTAATGTASDWEVQQDEGLDIWIRANLNSLPEYFVGMEPVEGV